MHNPGSDEARAAGCICPVWDNHYGRGRPMSGGVVFVKMLDCPLHGEHEHTYLSPCCGGSALEPWGIAADGTGLCAKCHKWATFVCACGKEAE